MITDEDIKKRFENKQAIRIDFITEEYKEYLKNRYVDSKSLKESAWRILHNIEIRPTCINCGKEVEFVGRKNNIFAKTCSKECTSKIISENTINFYKNISPERLKEIVQKGKKTCLERYGVENIFARPDVIEKTRIAAKEKHLEILEKIKQTNLQRYGVEHAMQNKEIANKSYQTKKNNGWISPWVYDNPMKKEEIKEKAKQTNRERYGGNSPTCSKEVKEKQKKTRYEKYGGKYTIYSEQLLKYLSEKQFDKNTQNKIKETSLLKYGVEHYSKSKEFKDYIHKHHQEIVEKGNNTKRKNGTFNTSSTEQESYKLLLEKFPNTLKDYKDKERYPFNCDFYIPELDLFIECQYHWTHGGHPYNEEKDKDQLEFWKSKDSQFYKNAINTWTIRDRNKRETAKKNNLNWIEFFTMNEFKKWLETL